MMKHLPAIFLFILFPLLVEGQLKIAGPGMDRGKFILNDGGKYIIASEVEDQETHAFKFLVFSTVSGTALNSYAYKGNMPYAINDFIKIKTGNYIALGERYLEGNRESMLLLEMTPALTPVRAKASYENGNEVEPYDILEYNDSYFITGFTKTSQLMSSGMANNTAERQQFYLTQYDREFNQLASYIITGFDNTTNPVGKKMTRLGDRLIIVGNIVGDTKSEAIILSIDIPSHTVQWAKRFFSEKNWGVTDLIVHDGHIVIQCTVTDKTHSDHVLVVMDTGGTLVHSWSLAEAGAVQRSQCMVSNQTGELMLFGTSGTNLFKTKRAAYLFSTKTGDYSVNLQGDGIQNETGGVAKIPTGYTNIGFEFSPGKNGIDIMLRDYTDAMFSSLPRKVAKEISLTVKPISLKIESYPATPGIFKSALFLEDVKYEPYYHWHVE